MTKPYKTLRDKLAELSPERRARVDDLYFDMMQESLERNPALVQLLAPAVFERLDAIKASRAAQRSLERALSEAKINP